MFLEYLSLSGLGAVLHVVTLGHVAEVSALDECELHLAHDGLQALQGVDLGLAHGLVVLQNLLQRIGRTEVLIDQ